MADESVNKTAGAPQFLAAIVRAIFVVGQVGLAVFLVVSTFSVIGLDGGMIYALAAVLASAAAIASVRFWLKGSWHVITVAFSTALLLLGIAFLLLLTSGNPGW